MQKTKGVILVKPGKMDLKKISVPALTADFALITVHSAVINPSDWYVLSGDFKIDKKIPAAMGCEGSGFVIETGTNCTSLKGKRVSFHASGPAELGAFAEQTVVHKSHIVILPNEIEYLHGSYFFINPWTVETIIVTAKKNGWKTLVHTAAASALGKMLVHSCKENDINLINIVRRQEQIDILKGCGAKIILNSQEPDFVDKMETIFDE
jgi:NADPH2:quinone reductase